MADEFETAFAEFTAKRRLRGGRPRKHHRDALVMIAVHRARFREHPPGKFEGGPPPLPFANDNAKHAKLTAFVLAARILRRDYRVHMTADAVMRAYYRRKRIEELKARFERLG